MKKYGHSLEINLCKKMDMNIPDHLLNPTGQVSIKDLENTITPSGYSSKRTFGPISSSPAGKHVKLQVPSPTCISTPTGAGKGMPAKSFGKGGNKQSLSFQAPRSVTAPAPSISPDYLRSLSAVKQQRMVELDNILESGAKETCKESIKVSLQALGLAVDEELLDNPEQLPKDSFSVQVIKFFPQYNKAGKLENAIAANICTGLCDYVSVESTNFSKVSKRLINTIY